MVSSPMLEIVRLSAPDALSALLLSASLYFLVEGKGLARFYLMLILSLFARLDNILFVILILAGAGLESKSLPGFSKGRFMMMVAGVVLCFFSITYLAVPYGWNLWYYPSFLKSMNLSYEASAQFNLKAYFALAISHILTGLFYSHLILFLITCLLIFIGEPLHSFRRLTQDQLLVWIFILFVPLRFVLHPVVADRFYIHIYLCTLVLLIRKIRSAPGSP
jgi:hypothetical protein